MAKKSEEEKFLQFILRRTSMCHFLKFTDVSLLLVLEERKGQRITEVIRVYHLGSMHI